MGNWKTPADLKYTRNDEWIRVEGVIKPVVAEDIFDAAQRRLKERQELTNVDLLNFLTALWCTAGDLPLNFHPAAARASADVTPFGAVSVSA